MSDNIFIFCHFFEFCGTACWNYVYNWQADTKLNISSFSAINHIGEYVIPDKMSSFWKADNILQGHLAFQL